MAKPYTIRDAIGELDTIRMEVSTLANRIPSISGNGVTLTDLSRLVSELSSVMLWFVRHMDRLEEGLYEGPELLPPELQEVTKKHMEWDGKSPHPYGCDGKDDDDENDPLNPDFRKNGLWNDRPQDDDDSN